MAGSADVARSGLVAGPADADILWRDVEVEGFRDRLKVFKVNNPEVLKRLDLEEFFPVPPQFNPLGEKDLFMGKVDAQEWLLANGSACMRGWVKPLMKDPAILSRIREVREINFHGPGPFFSLPELKAVYDCVARFRAVWEVTELWERCEFRGQAVEFHTVRRSKYGPFNPPRTIRYFKGGARIWVHFNQTGERKPDPTIGEGRCKRLKLVRDIVNREWLVQATASDVNPPMESIPRAMNEYHCFRVLEGRPGVVSVLGMMEHISKYQHPEGPRSRPVRKFSLFLPLACGSLWDFMKVLELREREVIALDLLTGAVGLQENEIVHLDLKGANVLIIMSEGRKRALICDLGLGEHLTEGKRLRGQHCPALIASPEYALKLLGEIDTPYRDSIEATKLNSWQIGLLLWDLLKLDFGGRYGTYPTYATRLARDGTKARPGDEVLRRISATRPTFLGAEPEVGTMHHLVWRLLRPRTDERSLATEALEEIRGIVAAGQSG